MGVTSPLHSPGAAVPSGDGYASLSPGIRAGAGRGSGRIKRSSRGSAAGTRGTLRFEFLTIMICSVVRRRGIMARHLVITVGLSLLVISPVNAAEPKLDMSRGDKMLEEY